MKRLYIIVISAFISMLLCSSCKKSDKINESSPDRPFDVEYDQEDTNYLGGYGHFESISSGFGQVVFEDDCYLYFCGNRLNKLGSDEFVPICSIPGCSHSAEADCLSYNTVTQTIPCADKCYYINSSELFLVDEDSGNKKLIHNFSEEIDTELTALYGINDSDIMIICTTGGKSVIYSTADDKIINIFNNSGNFYNHIIVGDYVYYVDERYYLSCINYKTGESTDKIIEDKVQMYFCIRGDYVYYINQFGQFCSCDKQGKGKTVLPYKAQNLMCYNDKIVASLYNEDEYIGLCFFNPADNSYEIISTEQFSQPLYIKDNLIYSLIIKTVNTDESEISEDITELCVINLDNKQSYYYPINLG